MSGMAIEDGGVSVADLSRVVHDDNLGFERHALFGGVVLGVGGDETSLDFLDGDVLDVETDVVSGYGLGHGFVMHLNRFNLSGQSSRSEGDNHVGFDDTGLDTSNGDCSNSTNFVDILEGKSEGLSSGSSGGSYVVKSLGEVFKIARLAGFLGITSFDGDTSEPLHILSGGGSAFWDHHVVTVESRNGDERNPGDFVSDLLEVVADLTLDFLVSGLAVRRRGGVHLVDGDNDLFDSKSEGK